MTGAQIQGIHAGIKVVSRPCFYQNKPSKLLLLSQFSQGVSCKEQSLPSSQVQEQHPHGFLKYCIHTDLRKPSQGFAVCMQGGKEVDY